MYLSCTWPPCGVFDTAQLCTARKSLSNDWTGLDCILLYGEKFSHTKTFADWSLEKVHENFSQFDDC